MSEIPSVVSPIPVDPVAHAQLPVTALHEAQRPATGRLNLDHVAHFVADREAAAAALERLGFTLTPFSEQSHRTEVGGPLVPAGSGNRCAMLREGYLEFLSPIAETPIAEQLRASIRRYTGVHLIAYGSADADADHARLERHGFDPLPPVALQRQARTATDSTTTVRFTVTRTAPGTMPEGRIQFCCHHTPEGVWQLRWLEHANRAAALRRVFVAVDDPVEAAGRYGRYSGIAAEAVAGAAGCEFAQSTSRGTLHLMDGVALRARLGIDAPTLPWIAGYELASDDLSITRAVLDASGTSVHALDDARLRVDLPPELGGVIVFVPLSSG
ncbi:MAG: VOC family protein [Proteobacteria bacterium]|nr:VOC family protein [Burkholderiales bacterium]